MAILSNIAWQLFAFVVSRKPVADYLIGRATRTPYFNLPGYMDRDWLFNAYSAIRACRKVSAAR